MFEYSAVTVVTVTVLPLGIVNVSLLAGALLPDHVELFSQFPLAVADIVAPSTFVLHPFNIKRRSPITTKPGFTE
jgi:hypothetical protein